MTLAPPDPATLRAYLEGTLVAEEAEAIRKWLIVAATPEVLAMLDDMAAEIEHARARLAYWAGQPLRARLARLAWRARCMVGHSFRFDLDHRAPLAGTLGGERAEVRASAPRRKLTVSPGEAREVLVSLAEATWFGVYAVERSGSLIVLAPGSTRHAANDRIEAGGLVMDADDVSLDVFVVFDSEGPLPAAPLNADAAWLAALLDPAEVDGRPAGRSVLWTTLEVTAVEAAKGPEERLPVPRDLESQPVMGIITALPKEYAAVRAMLDEPVDISRGGRSQRKYVEGAIPGIDGGAHRVVLALLPAMGNNSATQRATLLLEHFPSVRNLLMVGIAGGAPNPARAEEHVRLGDVVVSGSHGIVQYDYVAETIAETMHRHPPRPPSASLLEAVNILAALELSGQRPWLTHMKRAAAIRDSARPDTATDVLLATPPETGKVAHPHDPDRRPEEPRVFVGVIGSANKLVRNPDLRDRMRDKFKIRAFEMEGSGIADASWGLDVGYLAIRGICDYCDSAKNDTWQNYAAVAAAGYMRALLESLPAPRSSDHPFRSQQDAATREAHRAQYLSAIKLSFSKLTALATIPGAGLHPHARLAQVYVPRSLKSDTESRSLLDWMREPGNPSYLILGEVGSGKSALLLETQDLAAREAEHDARAPLPLLVRARELRSSSPLDSIASNLEISNASLEYLVQDPHSRWWLMVDGADEIADGAWPYIERFTRQLQRKSLLVGVAITARPVARSNQTEYRTLLLEPWSNESLDRFLQCWRQIQPGAVAALTASTYFDNLRDTLLSNPLMATLCLLLAEQGGEIPQDRTRIFVEVLEILFEGWRQTRRDPPSITWSRLAPVLGRLAIDHLRNGAPGISARALKDAIRSEGIEPVLVAADEAERELGVLVSRPDGKYDFAFRSFAEYLAAACLPREQGSVISHAYAGWSEEIARHALGLIALQDRREAEAVLRQLVEPLNFAEPSQEPIHVRPLLVALRGALDLEHCISSSIEELETAAIRALADEYSCWMGDRVAEELRRHARGGSQLWKRSFSRILPHLFYQGDLFRWYTANPPRDNTEALLALKHREPSVRALALRRLSADYLSANPLLLVHELFDRGLDMGTGLPIPAVAAATHLRGMARETVAGLLGFLNRLLEVDDPLLAGVAAIALRPAEAPAARLVAALQELARHGYQIPQEPIAELESTEAGAQALHDIWPDRTLPRHGAYLLAATTPLPRERPLSSAVVLRVIGCLENGLHSLPSDLLPRALSQRTPPGDRAACAALFHGDLRLADPKLLPLLNLEPSTQRILGRAVRATPVVARALLEAWTAQSSVPDRIGSLPGLALEPLVLDGNSEAMHAYVQWLEHGRLGGTNHVIVPDPRVIALPEVEAAARRVVQDLIRLALVGEPDRSGRHVYLSTGAISNALNSLSLVWIDDTVITSVVEEWVKLDDVNEYLAGLRCFDRLTLDPSLRSRLRDEILRKLKLYLAGAKGRYAYEALEGMRWLERNRLVAQREVLDVIRSLFDKDRTRAAAIAIATPFLSNEEATALSIGVAPQAVGLNTEHLSDVELLRLVGSAPDAWAEAVVSTAQRVFFPDPDLFRTVRLLPAAQQLNTARLLYQRVTQWELPWITESLDAVGRPVDLARKLLYDAGLDLRDPMGQFRYSSSPRESSNRGGRDPGRQRIAPAEIEPPRPRPPTKHTILFLAANPSGADPRALDREARAIQVELERSGFRDRFELVTRWAAEPLDLLRELRKLRPTVVHFSGHAAGDHRPDPAPRYDVVGGLGHNGGEPRHGLFFQGSDGRPHLVSVEALQETFGAVEATVKLVVLSACYSAVQAQALLPHVGCIVGMNGTIRDDAARSFAIGFYGGLGERQSIAAAYKQGCAAISLEGLSDLDRPQLAVRADVDASKLVLAADP